MMNFTIYRTDSGFIENVLDCPESHLEINTPDGCSAILGDYDNSIYRVDIATHTAVLKDTIPYVQNKSIITADGTDFVLFSNLPSNCVVRVDNAETQLSSSTFELDVDLAGEYEIVFSHPLYLDTTARVTAI